MRAGSGMTLVEVLIVIAVIALLAAMLVPSLLRSREMAQRIACATNQRRLMQATWAYARDNHGFGPYDESIEPTTTWSGPWFTTFLTRYTGAGSLQRISGTIWDPTVACPSFSPSQRWAFSAVALNNLVVQPAAPARPQNLFAVERPSSQGMWSDCYMGTLSPSPGQVPERIGVTVRGQAVGDMVLVRPRHGGEGANIACLDEHAEWYDYHYDQGTEHYEPQPPQFEQP